ncbi:MAG: hypothetical protein FJZ88_03200 [Chloroflexi bacterium]|nr:hypothetical protein [Chloroflexota bacterium]
MSFVTISRIARGVLFPYLALLESHNSDLVFQASQVIGPTSDPALHYCPCHHICQLQAILTMCGAPTHLLDPWLHLACSQCPGHGHPNAACELCRGSMRVYHQKDIFNRFGRKLVGQDGNELT